MNAERLYTPEMLAAAMELGQFPPLPDAPLHGSARSPACGSTLDLDLATNSDGAIARIGLRVRACAVGQAAAAIFARHAIDRQPAEIATTLAQLRAWLGGAGPEPDWPDIDLIAAACNYQGRHGAMLLPWNAAIVALSSGVEAG